MENEYSISEFAKLLGLSKSAIYNYERTGKLPQAKRRTRGCTNYRIYTVEDVQQARKLLGQPPLFPECRVQLFLNFKGGTGKSVISANYGYRLAQKGIKVLMVDLDAQGHLTKCLGINDDQFQLTLYDVIIEKTPIQQAIIQTSLPTLDLIPAKLDLSPLELALIAQHGREHKLTRVLGALKKAYDLIIMDAPPNLGILNVNAILSSDDLIVPVLADFLSYDGLKILFETLTDMEADLSHRMDGIYILINRFNPSHNICIRSRDAIRQHYSDYVLDTVIRQNTTISDATASQLTIFQHAPFSRGAKDIDQLIQEIFGL